MKQETYLLEAGYLLDKNDSEYECYNVVYDKKYGYYDILQHLILKEDLEKNIKEHKELFKSYDNVYLIITYQGLFEWEDKEELDNCDFLSFVEYETQNVVYSLKKENGKIEENFI